MTESFGLAESESLLRFYCRYTTPTSWRDLFPTCSRKTHFIWCRWTDLEMEMADLEYRFR